jgi:site-specific recombinase XerD
MELAISRPTWTTYFNQPAAVESVYAHMASLPSSRTEEKYTAAVYRGGLQYFMNWSNNALPTPDLMRVYMAHLVQRGLAASTINARYLTSVRHYLRALANQMITGLTGKARDFVADCKEQIRQAIALPSPKPGTSSNLPPLWRPDFHRLTLDEVNHVLRSIDRSTLAGLRDYTLLHIAFTTGLRLAELARINLAAIRPSGAGNYIVIVRGKRNNIDPVPFSADAYVDLLVYVWTFNSGLPVGDVRRIRDSVPVFQPLHRETFYMASWRYDAADGLSHQAIRDAVTKRSRMALGYAIAVHDTRRTAAYLAHKSGMDLPDIQQMLRHKQPDITWKYIGSEPNYETRMLSKLLAFGDNPAKPESSS